MNKPTLTGALLMLLAMLVACAGQIAPPHGGPPPASTLPELTPGEWTALSPGGETICADGSPYTLATNAVPSAAWLDFSTNPRRPPRRSPPPSVPVRGPVLKRPV